VQANGDLGRGVQEAAAAQNKGREGGV
jgi:hypothetical protein